MILTRAPESPNETLLSLRNINLSDITILLRLFYLQWYIRYLVKRIKWVNSCTKCSFNYRIIYWAKNFLERMGGHMRNWRHNIFRPYVARINIQRHLPSSNNEQKMSSNHISSVCKWNMLSADFAASVHQVSHVSWSATSVVFRLHFIWIVTHSRSAWPLKFRQTRVSARFLRKIQMLGLCSFNMFKLTTC